MFYRLIVMSVLPCVAKCCLVVECEVPPVRTLNPTSRRRCGIGVVASCILNLAPECSVVVTLTLRPIYPCQEALPGIRRKLGGSHIRLGRRGEGEGV
jgi:hypothetical protein